MARLKTRDGWEERADSLCTPDAFVVSIQPSLFLDSSLTPDEKDRLAKKLSLVASFASEMASGMLKGTLKYPTDGWTHEQFAKEQRAEYIDNVNYELLKEQANGGV